MARQDKSKPGRITPKGTTSTPASSESGRGSASGVGREPVKVDTGSSIIVPIIMFGSLIVGGAVILFNYLTEDILGTPDNLYLFGGLGLVLIGIIAATQYR